MPRPPKRASRSGGKFFGTTVSGKVPYHPGDYQRRQPRRHRQSRYFPEVLKCRDVLVHYLGLCRRTPRSESGEYRALYGIMTHAPAPIQP